LNLLGVGEFEGVFLVDVLDFLSLNLEVDEGARTKNDPFKGVDGVLDVNPMILILLRH
jgi:hypothetical protein